MQEHHPSPYPHRPRRRPHLHLIDLITPYLEYKGRRDHNALKMSYFYFHLFIPFCLNFLAENLKLNQKYLKGFLYFLR